MSAILRSLGKNLKFCTTHVGGKLAANASRICSSVDDAGMFDKCSVAEGG